MNILTHWLRSYLPALPVDDRQLAEDLTLRGIAVEGEFPIDSGTRFEMDITTNRVDAMNHYGIAREAAAIYNLPFAPLAETAPLPETQPGPGFPVRIDAPDLCGRFTARILRGVTVGPSTGLIAGYFAALPQKPISAPVDITNFCWLAIGQPTHVFDLDTITGSIIVRRANPGETLRLLDGTERTLVPDDLVIADETKALGLAGVMGGWDSRVTEATKNILVEAAWFDPAAIRASSRRHGLHTDASHRFERGADFNAAPLANNLVARMIVAHCGGEVIGPLVDVIVPQLAAKTAERAEIGLRISQVQRHLGTTLDGSEISSELVRQYLSALGCHFSSVHDTTTVQPIPGVYAVTLPSWRLDLEREIDLIEEVARVYGYNKFADTLPAFTGAVREVPHAVQERALRETMLALGFSETVSSTFTSAEDATTFGDGGIPMGNPLSAEAGMLRPSLAPGMAAMLALNLHRDVRDVRLFELGTLFTGSTAEVHEATSLSLGLTGSPTATPLFRTEDALFYETKGAIETLLGKFDGPATFDTTDLPAWIAPGRGARATLGSKTVAVFGELSAAELQARKIKQTCVLAEIHAQLLLATPLRKTLAHDISRYQAVERDFSFIFPDAVRWQQIDSALREARLEDLTSVTPLEVFRDPKGKSVAAGSYSLLLRVVFQSMQRTLTEEELTAWSERIVDTLKTMGGIQRV